MKKSAQSILSAYSFITSYDLDKILDTGYLSKNGNPIPSFDEKLLIDLCSDVQEILKEEKNVLELKGDFIIVGDIHGSLHDLLRILKYIQQNKSKVLFLGDYVDRGNFSLECITILFALKVMKPEDYYLLRGNHEFESVCSQYGFKSEILDYHNPKKTKNSPNTPRIEQVHSLDIHSEDEYYESHNDVGCYKYSEALYEAFIQAFSYLPIAATLNDTTFCIHGGISPRSETIKLINKTINRPINSFEENILLSDVVWSDPSENYETLYEDNPRGKGYLFNEYALTKFLTDNSLHRLIRAHQCVQNGYSVQFDQKCLTVFSASSYSTYLGNNSAILQLFESDDSITITTFQALGRLQKSDAIFYKVESLYRSDGEKAHSCFSLLHPRLNTNQGARVVGKKRGRSTIKPQLSDNFLPLQSPYINSSPLIRPKLVTNKRRSYQLAKRPAIQQHSSLQTFDEIKIDDESVNLAPGENSFLAKSLVDFIGC